MLLDFCDDFSLGSLGKKKFCKEAQEIRKKQTKIPKKTWGSLAVNVL